MPNYWLGSLVQCAASIVAIEATFLSQRFFLFPKKNEILEQDTVKRGEEVNNAITSLLRNLFMELIGLLI